MAHIDYSIKDVEKVVKFNGKVKNVEVSRLTAPGENYLSLVLRVDFEVEKDGHLETISAVAKRLPLNPKKEEFGFDFHGFAMKNEIRWYSEIVPLLQDLAKKNKIELGFYPKCYGSRLSLDSSKEEADSDSVLLLENLIPQGYKNDDRYIGSDLVTSKAILKNLALFHALPIATKVKKPETFKIIKDFLDSIRPPPPPTGPDGEKNPFGPPPGAPKPEEILLEKLEEIPDIVQFIPKIKLLFKNKPMGPETFGKITKEPWNTITHNDFWVNNVMVNTSSAEEPLVKIVDFQMCSYGSFAKDLVFFLLTSVRNDLMKESMDDLLRFYYEEFTSALQKTQSDLDLTYENYLEEVRFAASESEVSHAMGFSAVIFGEKGTGIDVAVEEFDPFTQMTDMMKKMNQQRKDRLVVIASEATKRNWL